jgi:hypothetical protein
MGNITSLQRTSAGATIDNLTYNYIIGGNPTYQINTITDISGNSSGMANGVTTVTARAFMSLPQGSCLVVR